MTLKKIIPTTLLRDEILFSDSVREVVTTEQLCSLPIPCLNGESLEALAFYYGRHFDPISVQAVLYPPVFIASFDWTTGKFKLIRSTAPDFLGLATSRFDAIGRADYRSVDIAAREAGLGGAVHRSGELDTLYDILVPLWAEGLECDSETADRFRTLFWTVEPRAYEPAYRRLGQSFFAWVGL